MTELPDFDKSWTLFLDRDGVINQRYLGTYIKTLDEFEYLPGSLEAIVKLNKFFNKIIIVTNQKGVGKGRMTQQDLDHIHKQMLTDLKNKGGKVDAVYAATAAKLTPESLHKPNPGMALKAQAAFPEIDFKKSVIVGDSISDMEFGFGLGMWTVLVEGKEEEKEAAATIRVDQRVTALAAWAQLITTTKNL